MNKRESFVKIVGAGHAFPETLLDNRFFEGLDIGTDASWIEDRTGIKTRFSSIQKEDIAQLRQKKTTYDQLRRDGKTVKVADLVSNCLPMLKERLPSFAIADAHTFLLATCFPDHDIPANACVAAKLMGAHTATAIDMNTACSGFVTSLRMAESLMLRYPENKVLLGVSDRPTTKVDYTDRSSCILFGDSAALFSLEVDSPLAGFKVLDSMTFGDPVNWHKVLLEVGGMFTQDGKSVQKFAITKTIEATKLLLARNNMQVGDLDYFIAHQANFRMLQSVVRKLEISQERHLYNVDRCGNQGGSGSAVVLSENWDQFEHGDKLLICVVGGGLTWGSVLLEFDAPNR